MKRTRRYWPRYFLVHDSGFPASSVNEGNLHAARESYKRAGWHVATIGPVSSMEQAMKAAAPLWAKWRAAEKELAERAERLAGTAHRPEHRMTTLDDPGAIGYGSRTSEKENGNG